MGQHPSQKHAPSVYFSLEEHDHKAGNLFMGAAIGTQIFTFPTQGICLFFLITF